jgi:hypothetical protein
MIDDIESRLRRPATAPNWATADSWMLEGADEIAALRKEVVRLKAAVLAERERCAALCDVYAAERHARDEPGDEKRIQGHKAVTAHILANRIRGVNEEAAEARASFPGLEKMP